MQREDIEKYLNRIIGIELISGDYFKGKFITISDNTATLLFLNSKEFCVELSAIRTLKVLE